MLADSHAHLDDECFTNEVDTIIKNAKEAGVGFILNPGTKESSSDRAVALSNVHDIVYAAVGFHPSYCTFFDKNKHLNMIKDWCKEEKVLAIGEIGLDYHYDDDDTRDLQKNIFEEQIALANKLKKPIIIHDRDAHDDCLDMVKSCLDPNVGGVFHSYSGSLEMAKVLLNFGIYLSIGGPLTFKNSRKAIDMVSYIPLEFLFIESDSPYLTPVPYRGKRNEPAYICFVAKKIAEIKKMEVEEIEKTTFENCRRLFGV